MDLRTLQKSLADAKRRLHFDENVSENTPKPRVLKSRDEVIEEALRKREDEERQSRSRVTAPPSHARLKELAADRSEYYQRLQRRKEEEESFLRDTLPIASEIDRQTACERLYEDSSRREQRLSKLREEELYKAHLSNKRPLITPFAKSLASTPLPYRTDAILKHKEENLSRLRTSLEERDAQFAKSCSRKVDVDKVTERLLAEADDMKRRREDGQILAAEQAKPVGTPKIDPLSRRMAERRFSKTFIERQGEIQEQRRIRLEIQRRQADMAQEASSRKVLSPNSASKVFERLVREGDKIRESRAKVGEEYAAQFTFNPRISEKSKLLAPTGSGFDRLYRNAEGNKKKEFLSEKLKKEELKDCTFRPNLIPSTYWHTTNDVTLQSAVAKRQIEREEKLRRAKLEQEMKEAKECTFTPKIRRCSLISSSQSTVHMNSTRNVKGVDAFMRRKSLADEMKVEQRKREEKVFLTNLSRGYQPVGPTWS